MRRIIYYEPIDKSRYKRFAISCEERCAFDRHCIKVFLDIQFYFDDIEEALAKVIELREKYDQVDLYDLENGFAEINYEKMLRKNAKTYTNIPSS